MLAVLHGANREERVERQSVTREEAQKRARALFGKRGNCLFAMRSISYILDVLQKCIVHTAVVLQKCSDRHAPNSLQECVVCIPAGDLHCFLLVVGGLYAQQLPPVVHTPVTVVVGWR